MATTAAALAVATTMTTTAAPGRTRAPAPMRPPTTPASTGTRPAARPTTKTLVPSAAPTIRAPTASPREARPTTTTRVPAPARTPALLRGPAAPKPSKRGARLGLLRAGVERLVLFPRRDRRTAVDCLRKNPRPEQALDLVTLKELLANHHALDLGGSLADQKQRRVAVETLDLVLLRVAVAAVDAEALLDALLAGLRGKQL